MNAWSLHWCMTDVGHLKWSEDFPLTFRGQSQPSLVHDRRGTSQRGQMILRFRKRACSHLGVRLTREIYLSEIGQRILILDKKPSHHWCHIPSTAFRHLPPNSARQVTPLRGTLYLHEAVHRRGQRPPKGLGTNMTVDAT